MPIDFTDLASERQLVRALLRFENLANVVDPSDADAFSDLGLPGESLLDALNPALSQQLDSVADQIGGIITPDNDAYYDLVQALDPNAATDSLGMFAVDLDTLLTPFGFEPALDAATDNLLSLFGLAPL